MKILIITVGNRQIGWRCEDEIVRCVGVSGDPDHIAEIYQEIGVEKPAGRYFARHLGKSLYEVCAVDQNFSAVELLLDQNLIAEEVKNDLQQVWLISTDQPDSVADSFRASDTTWLAQLMAGKIRQTWQDLTVKTLDFQVDISRMEAIRLRFEEIIQDLTKKVDSENDDQQMTLLIENKGSVPALSSSLEIYAAALVRQFDVVRVVPREPSPMYLGDQPSRKSANFAEKFDRQSMSQYFLPLERLRIISAWERGDFGEAKIWLEGHRNRYAVLYDLVGYLENAGRQDMRGLLQTIKGKWLPMKKLKQLASPEQILAWSQYDCLDKTKTAAIIWEYAFQIPIDAETGRLSNAFFLMAQTLERLLFQLYKKDRWLEKGWVEISEELQSKGIGKDRFLPRLEELIKVWSDQYGYRSQFDMLNGIREKRNKIVHEAAGVSFDEIKTIWGKANLSIESIGDSLLLPLQSIGKKVGNLPPKPLLLSLYEWGFNVLRK
jgi:hypothetical protein